MAQFDLYAGLGGGKGYVVDVQTGLLDRLASRVGSVPLLPRRQVEIINDLTPIIRDRRLTP